jgi:hypothetical protein
MATPTTTEGMKHWRRYKQNTKTSSMIRTLLAFGLLFCELNYID